MVDENEEKQEVSEGEEEVKEKSEINPNAPTKESIREIKRLQRRIGQL